MRKEKQAEDYQDPLVSGEEHEHCTEGSWLSRCGITPFTY